MKNFRSIIAPAVCLLLIVLFQSIVCETASAQRLLDRLRARIESRRADQPLPPPPQTPLRSPNNPFSNPASLAPPNPGASPRVLATPTPGLTAKPPVQSAGSGPTLARPRASLGVEARDATPQRGALIVSAREGAAGAIGGLQPGDRVVSAAGRLVRDTNSLGRELSLFNPGETVTLGIVRGETMQELEIEMGGPGGVLAKSATESERTSDAESILQKPEPQPTEPTAPTEPIAPNMPAGNQEQTSPDGASGESLLSGMGSVLGNFFSSASSGKPQTTSKQTPATSDRSMPDASMPDASILDDPLALPEDTAAGSIDQSNGELPAPAE